MIMKEILKKALSYDLDKPVVLDNKNGTFTDIISINECTDGYGKEIISIKTK